MKKYTCIIVDDESLAQELIENHLTHFPNISIIKKCSTGIEALNFLNLNEVDIMFLDINMPNLNGIDLLKTLKKAPLTIFTTAYSEHAILGYELNVIDYLLKPIKLNRFCIAINKTLELLNKEEHSNTFLKDHSEFIYVKSDFKAVKVILEDILYIEGMQKYIKIHFKESYITTLMSLTKINEILSSNTFMRCQKSFIVNTTKINSIEGNFVQLENGTKIPLNKDSKQELIKKLDPNNLL